MFYFVREFIDLDINSFDGKGIEGCSKIILLL